MPETKICRACGNEKLVRDFYVKRITAGGITQYRPDCRACAAAAIAADPAEKERIRLKTAMWRAADPERGHKSCRDSRNAHIDERRAGERAKQADPVTGPKRRAQRKASYYRHRERRIADTKAWEAAHPGYRAAYGSSYWKNNPDKGREHRDKRRARLTGVGGNGYTDSDVRRMWEEQGGLCANPYCCVDLAVVGYAVDHRHPISKGGRNEPANLQLLCSPPRGSSLPNCNSRKRSKPWLQFLSDYAKVGYAATRISS